MKGVSFSADVPFLSITINVYSTNSVLGGQWVFHRQRLKATIMFLNFAHESEDLLYWV